MKTLAHHNRNKVSVVMVKPVVVVVVVVAARVAAVDRQDELRCSLNRSVK